MNLLDLVGALVSVVVIIYLLIALFRAEEF
jgi:K+-transporting ATPase KdpF subunit